MNTSIKFFPGFAVSMNYWTPAVCAVELGYSPSQPLALFMLMVDPAANDNHNRGAA